MIKGVLIVTAVTWCVQVAYVFSTLIFEPDMFRSKKQVLRTLIPYYFTVSVVKGLIKTWENLE